MAATPNPLWLRPSELASARAKYLMEPAVTALAGRDQRLSRSEASKADQTLVGPLRAAIDDIERHFEQTPKKSTAVHVLVASDLAAAERSAVEAADADGVVRKVPAGLRADLEALLGGPELLGARFSPRVVRAVMDAYALEDSIALLREAVARHDDGNRYLKRSELEAAAKALTGELDELGIVSDLDKTLIPPHDEVLPERAYPGVSTLLQELDRRDGGRPGDVTYVTARTPESAGADVQAWLRERGFPEGPIETGISGIPHIAEREKIADIVRVMDANPGQRFVFFGDSSHRDPEVYRGILARYPDRVAAAFINRVNNVNPARLEGLVGIDDYAQAAARLLELGILDQAAARRVMVATQVEGLDITDADIDALLGRGPF